MKYAVFYKRFVLTAFAFLIALATFAQKEFAPENESNFFDRVYTGGSLNFEFGNFTFIDVSPLAGYMITNMFSAGIGVTYRYISIREANFKTHVYGGRVFARHNLGSQFFLYTEYENLSFEFELGEHGREWVPGFFVGGGLYQPLGSSGVGFTVMGLYNFAYDVIRSPYNSPWVFRVGFTL